MNIKLSSIAVGLVLLTGCATSPIVWFEPNSRPIPQQGYKVLTEEGVTGSSSAFYILFFGFNVLKSHQYAALKEAKSVIPGTDALVDMAIDSQWTGLPPLFWWETTRVTGTPVQFIK